MEEKFTVQKLTLKDFEGIEFGPNGFQIDYLAAIAKRALDILDREKQHVKKKDKGKRKFSDSEQRDEQRLKKKDEGTRESCDLDHLDEQPTKKTKLEEINTETLDQPRFSGGFRFRRFSKRVISRKHRQENLSNRMCIKERSESVIKRSDQRRRNEDCVQSRQEVLRREKLLKRPIVRDKTASDDEFQEVKKTKKRKNNKKLDIDHALGPSPDLPREFMETLQIFAEGKSIEEPQLVIQKGLFDTDLSKGHNRVSLPSRQILREFLTKDEFAELHLRIGRNVKTKEVDIIEPSLQRSKISLRRWEMTKPEGNSSVSYVLARTWNKLVSRNSLRAGHVVQFWSTRVDGELWLLLVRIPNSVLRTPGVSQHPGNENEAAGPSVLPSDPSNEAGPSSSSLEPDQDHRGQD